MEQPTMNQQPSPQLYQRIIQRIEREKRLAILKRNIAYSSSFLLLSAIGFFIGTKIFYAEAASSGMFNFIALGFIDARVLSQNFSEFALSIIQAVPIDTLAVVLALLVIMLGSARSLWGALNGFKITSHLQNF
jgi:hypothetical protein